MLSTTTSYTCSGLVLFSIPQAHCIAQVIYPEDADIKHDTVTGILKLADMYRIAKVFSTPEFSLHSVQGRFCAGSEPV